MPEETKNAMERHAQSVLVVIVVALLSWVGVSVEGSGKEIVRLQQQVLALSARLDVVTGLPDRVARLEVRVSQLEPDRGARQ